MRNRITPSMVVSITALVFSTTGSAFAAKTLIDGGDIKNGSITAADIKDHSLSSRDLAEGSISLDRLSDGTRRRINEKPRDGKDGVNGTNGRDGTAGANGKDGVNGKDGAAGANATSDSGNWGVVSRNVIGSPDIFLRGGPATAPMGTGSLGFSVGSPAEKAAYGNEKDFVGEPVSDLNEVGFSVFTTGEDAARGKPNMPSITFEIDPNLAATQSNFSSLVFVPNNTAPNAWTSIDATDPDMGFWFLTGAAGTATNCNQTTTCTFSQVKDALGTGATILTAQVTKGRDFEWQGAVDALRINAQVFDFEANGVTVRAA